MRKNKLFHFMAVASLAILSLSVLAGCAAKLPEGYVEADVKSTAESVIMLLDGRDGDGLRAFMTEEMKTGLTEDVMAQIYAVLDAAGGVREIVEMKSGGSTQNGVTYAVVIAKVRHANQDITYTISFNPEMQLAGLYLK